MGANNERAETEKLIKILSALTFLIFFQAFMIAPLIPKLAAAFGESAEKMGQIVPAYLFPYGLATLFYGFLSDHFGRRKIMLLSLASLTLLSVLTATAASADQILAWRFITGLGASGVVPLALALIGSLYPMNERGRPLGWLFGAMAGGMAFGSSFGLFLEPFIGWRGLFVGTGVLAASLMGLLFRYRHLLGVAPAVSTLTLRGVFKGYTQTLTNFRAVRTYLYVFVNAVFHSGIYTWLGLYFVERYSLGEIGIGLALLGYGIPGFVLGPIIGKAADRFGRSLLIPAGFGIAAIAALLLIPNSNLVVAAVLVTLLSLGYDMTQPLLAGIVTALDPKRAGQAMGLNVFCLFTGFASGSYLFSKILFPSGFGAALSAFGVTQLLVSLLAIYFFAAERRV